LTEETVAEKLALVEPAATVTEAGTVTEVLLLDRLAVKPLLAAAAFSETVQASVPDPVIDELEQANPLRTGMPVPLSAMVAVPFVDELLAMINWPDAAPAVVGSNWTMNVAVWFGLTVSGKLAPESEKPAPLMDAELMVTAAVPVDDSVIDCEIAEFTATVPKFTLEELSPRAGTAAFSCSAKVWAALPELAESVTACAVLTEETVAEKLALVAPAATVTEAGTVTAALPLARFTVKPPLAAAVFNETEQASVPAPVMDEFVHASFASEGTPVPLRTMAVLLLADELLAIVN
jgi:hypothetical protein